MEVLVVSSTTIMMMDLLREALLHRPKGLPLGLLSAGFRFSDLTYFWTPDFIWGGLVSGRIVISASIAVAGLLAVFSGPATALLVFPTRSTDWPAGGASFYLSGSTQTLWPTNLTLTSTGPATCQTPSKAMIEGLWLNLSSCIWNGYPLVAQAFQALHFNTEDNEIEMTDGIVKRILSVQIKGRVSDTWALAIDMATGAYSSELASAWYNMALFGAPSVHNKYRNFQYRERNSTVTNVRTILPAVRTNCNLYENISFLTMNNSFQPEYQPALTAIGFLLPSPTGYNSSRVTAQWRPISNYEPIGVNVDPQGNWISGWPSVFLDVQIPYQDQSSTGVFMSCSIDARWAVGDVVGTNIGYMSGVPVQQPSIPTQASVLNNWPAVNDGTWQTVRLEQSWLDALTPVLDNTTSHWTTLSSVISATGADNSSSLVVAYGDIIGSVEAAIASLVVDGMSRVGYVDNGGQYEHISDSEYLFYIPTDDGGKSLDALLEGTLEIPPSASDSQSTPLRWDVAITGLAYNGNSASYYLALTVLYIHALLAILHTAYSLWNRMSFSAWESLTDLLVLCLTSSSASAELENTTGGINEHALYKKRTWVRAVKSDTNMASISPPSTLSNPQVSDIASQPSDQRTRSNNSLGHVVSEVNTPNRCIPGPQGKEELLLIVGDHNSLAPRKGYAKVHANVVYKTMASNRPST
ncbi:hypothetical protein N7490_002063 [Penicillium lividum]|nr:hypothetical protein N7490_002063 [Penicillium lividum]